MFAHSFFLTHPNSWRKIVCAHFPWNNLYFSRNSHFIFIIFFRYHFHWYSIHYGNYLRWGSQQLNIHVNNKLNNSMYLYQNIIRADSENFFNGGGRGCKLWSQEHKSFLQQITSWPPLLNSPPPPCFACSYTNISLSTKSADECRTDMWSCHGWWEPSVCHRVTPSPLNNCDHNSAYCCQVSRPNKEGGRFS